jgi:RNA polymerase sigma-70 factor (ECF subfamily)
VTRTLKTQIIFLTLHVLREKLLQEEIAFEALQKGEEKGLAFFFNRYYSQLVFFSITITNNEASSDDAVKDAFIKLWKVRQSLAESKKIKALLYRIVRNASIDILREEKSRNHRSEVFYLEQHNNEGTVLQKMVEAETYQQLYNALSHLPPRCRQIFELFYFHDKPIKEIAEELGISVNTVKTQKQRAIQMLRENSASLSMLLFCVLLIGL